MARQRKVLDLFCGAGGASIGYRRAGFEVIGVDIEPQPHYPFAFRKADALDVLGILGPALAWHFDAIHASPPCQAYVRGGLTANDGRHLDLLPSVRELLDKTGLPYVIENVPGAPMRPDVILCGSQFGLEVRRHRWFESNVDLFSLLPPCDHTRPVAGVYGNPHGANGAAPGMLPGDLATWSRAMGIDWTTTAELAVAIPPAYTHHIGTQLLRALEVAA